MNRIFNIKSILLFCFLPLFVNADATFYYGCTKLQEVVLPSVLTSIGDEAMTGCSALTKVTCSNATPPTCGSNVFCDEVVTYRTLQTALYAGSNDYVTADTWYKFYDIRVSGNTSTNVSASTGSNNITIAEPSSTSSVTIPSTGIVTGLNYSLTFHSATGAITLDAQGSLKYLGTGTVSSGTSFTSLAAGTYLLTVNNITVRIIIYTNEN